MARVQKTPSLSQVPLQTLMTLLEIRKHGSAKLAAEKFGLTVSAITRQIQELEIRLGKIPLFDRHPRGMRLTPAGERYAAAARRVIDILDDARAFVASGGTGRAETIRLHISEALMDNYLSEVVDRFTREHPQASVDIVIGTAEQAYAALASGEASFATMFGLGELRPLDKRSGIEIVTKVLYPLIAVVDREHPLAGRGKMGIIELLRSGWPLAMPPETYSTRIHLQRLLDKVEPNLVLKDFVEVSMNSFAALKRYALHGRAVVVLPALAAVAEIDNKILTPIQIGGTETEKTSFSLCRRRGEDASPLTAELLDRLKVAFEQLSNANPGQWKRILNSRAKSGGESDQTP